MMRGEKGGQKQRMDAACQDLQEETFSEEATIVPAKCAPRTPNQRPWKAWNGDIRMPRAGGRVEDVRCIYLDQMQAGQYGTQTPPSADSLAMACPGLT